MSPELQARINAAIAEGIRKSDEKWAAMERAREEAEEARQIKQADKLEELESKREQAVEDIALYKEQIAYLNDVLGDWESAKSKAQDDIAFYEAQARFAPSAMRVGVLDDCKKAERKASAEIIKLKVKIRTAGRKLEQARMAKASAEAKLTA